MNATSGRKLRIIVNGKSTAEPLLRPAVSAIREQGHRVDVRVTWESGDAERYASEAIRDHVDVIVAAGGDGTVHEVAGGMLAADPAPSTALAVIPFGTANDFATSIGVLPGNVVAALDLAATGTVTPIDVGKVNDRIFVNVASGGFGAEVTARTPPQMKRAFGAAAYSLMGLVTAAKMNPYACRFTGLDDMTLEGNLLLMAVGNGRQCGGGYQVTPEAFLNDGLLDVVVVHDADFTQFGTVLNELLDMTDETNQFVTYKKVSAFSMQSERPLQLNLDGEPYVDKEFRFEVLPQVLPFVLGPDAPLA
jgi:lipid kinase YegS